MGLSQLKRLDEIVETRTKNLLRFIDQLDSNKFFTDFKLEGSSNYAFNLILKNPDKLLMNKLMKNLDKNGVEYRLGSAGGGNQLRQPYLKNLFSKNQAKKFKNTEHIHFYALYIGNYPELTKNNLNFIINLLNSVEK